MMPHLMTRAMLLAIAAANIALVSGSYSTAQADPPQPRRVLPPSSYQQELNERYSPLYRGRYGSPSRRLDQVTPADRVRSSYRFSFPLNRYRSVPNTSQYFYRRMTPYYDGRGYGVPSTSPFRYRRDLDGPRRLP